MSNRKNLPSVGVVGSGSFATAVVKMLMENSPKVHWLVRDDSTRESLLRQGNNPHYLTSVKFDPSRLIVTLDINELVSQCDVVVLATPSIYLADAIEKITQHLSSFTLSSSYGQKR